MNAVWITLALLAAGFVGWPVTALVFRLARTIDDKADAAKAAEDRAGADDQSANDPPNAAGTSPAPTTRILRGGAIIGVLERLAVCLAILGGQPIAIAYVVAIKGLGRFAELKETPVAAERFIIGTLASMLWAAGIAALAKILFLG